MVADENSRRYSLVFFFRSYGSAGISDHPKASAVTSTSSSHWPFKSTSAPCTLLLPWGTWTVSRCWWRQEQMSTSLTKRVGSIGFAWVVFVLIPDQ